MFVNSKTELLPQHELSQILTSHLLKSLKIIFMGQSNKIMNGKYQVTNQLNISQNIKKNTMKPTKVPHP